MNKKQRELLKGLSEKIDSIYEKEVGRKQMYTSIVNTKVSGEDAILAGHEEANEDQEYLVKSEMYHEVNHFRRLKRAFIKGSHDGVIKYLSKCGFTINENIIRQQL